MSTKDDWVTAAQLRSFLALYPRSSSLTVWLNGIQVPVKDAFYDREAGVIQLELDTEGEDYKAAMMLPGLPKDEK